MDDSDFLLNSDFNNQKILVDNSYIFNVGSPTFADSVTIDHNLGYIPAASVWYEPQAGRVYPLSVRQYNDGATSIYVEITGEFYLTTTQMVISLRNAGTASSCNVWVRIYLDD